MEDQFLGRKEHSKTTLQETKKGLNFLNPLLLLVEHNGVEPLTSTLPV